MQTESEAILENKLVAQLSALGYELITLPDEETLLSNLKIQLERHNRICLNEPDFILTDEEFQQIITHLYGGSIFNKAEKLRDRYPLKRDDYVRYLEFFNSQEWCKNIYQVSNQITMVGKRENRYDVTLLINGLPLVQIELKRRGLEMKQAFNQICRYEHESYKGLFQYIQIFVVSNGVNTKYFSNNREKNFTQTFFWTDEKNSRINRLDQFTEHFLEKCFVSKIIAQYIVLNQANKCLMVLRPYQYYAVEAIISKAVNNGNTGGYIWHATGSGKTLTAFKASQLLQTYSKIDKVIFVVDRKDLDDQTSKEFDAFAKGSVSSSDNTDHFIANLLHPDRKLIITTIQKLTRAINKNASKIDVYRDKKIVFIFDECHRSQFGDMHKAVIKFFTNAQLFGFTGTPIFEDNANKLRTTRDLFGECLHRYTITNAIRDKNVLEFSVEYIGKYTNRCNLDIDVEAINTKEVLESPKRIEKIIDYILLYHDAKTNNRCFTAILTVANIDTLITYYNLFKTKQHKLNIAAIYSWQSNEEVKQSKQHSRDTMESIITNYNQQFGSNYTTDTFDAYYRNVAQRVRDGQINLLIVVNMFLTGFDSKALNTLYVDKNLEYHGLIQAFSRTNRTFDGKKPFGNIVCFRNLKEKTDQAIRLYSDENASETVLMQSYQEYVTDFNQTCSNLHGLCPQPNDVDKLQSEVDQRQFVRLFRRLLHLKIRLNMFNDFTWQDLSLSEQCFVNYQSKYLDLYQMSKEAKQKVSVLDDIDFEPELLRKDRINVDYIITLLGQLNKNSHAYEKDKAFIMQQVDSSPELRSKQELINEFIDKNLPGIKDKSQIADKFEIFFDQAKHRAIYQLAEKEGLSVVELEAALEEYLFSGKIKGEILENSINDKTLTFLPKNQKFKKVKACFQKILDKFSFNQGI